MLLYRDVVMRKRVGINFRIFIIYKIFIDIMAEVKTAEVKVAPVKDTKKKGAKV